MLSASPSLLFVGLVIAGGLALPSWPLLALLAVCIGALSVLVDLGAEKCKWTTLSPLFLLPAGMGGTAIYNVCFAA